MQAYAPDHRVESSPPSAGQLIQRSPGSLLAGGLPVTPEGKEPTRRCDASLLRGREAQQVSCGLPDARAPADALQLPELGPHASRRQPAVQHAR